MKVIMMECSKQAEIKEIDSSLEEMQKIVGGPIELYCPFEDENVGIIVNEEGKILGLPENRVVVKSNKIIDILAGPAFIVNLDTEDDDFGSLTDAQIQMLKLQEDVNMAQLTYTPVDSAKLGTILKEHGINSIAALSLEMGRSNSYIQKQLAVYNGISKPVEAYLSMRFGIQPDDYKPEPVVLVEQRPVEMDADKLFGIVFKAAYSAAKEATKSPTPVRQELCAACYHKTLCTSFICRIAGGVDNKVRCDGCGKEAFGATYEILPR